MDSLPEIHVYGRRVTARAFREKFSVGPDGVGCVPGLPNARRRIVFHWRPWTRGYRTRYRTAEGPWL